MFYILCLKPIMETLSLHYFKLSQSQMSAVATGHVPLNITYNQLEQCSASFSTLKGTVCCHGSVF